MVSEYTINNLKVYKYIMPVITSNMYILIMDKQALIIDPNESKEAMELLEDCGVNDITILLTHEHFDHVSGVNFFREKYSCKAYGNHKCKAMVTDPSENLAAFFMAMLIEKSEEERRMAQNLFSENYSCQVDEGFEKEMLLELGGMSVKMIETPGHSPGSICIIINDRYIFTGDSLVDGNKVITRLPGGSRKDYNQITRPFLERLSEDSIIFPGHGQEGYMRDFQVG